MTEERGRAAVLLDTDRDLLSAAVVAHLATIRLDGTLQSNPVWFDCDGRWIRISTTKARQKARNIAHDPHVALSITDPEHPYRYLEVRGVVIRVDDDPEHRLIDELSQRYLGRRPYPNERPGDERIPNVVEPTDSSAIAA